MTTTHPTSAALHRAAVDLLELYDEDDVTVEMVLTRAGASKGSLYHHYRDFDSLLDRAQATRFAASVDGTIAELGRAAGREPLVGMLVRVAAGATAASNPPEVCGSMHNASPAGSALDRRRPAT